MSGYRDDQRAKLSALPKIVLFGLVSVPFLIMLGGCVLVYLVAKG